MKHLFTSLALMVVISVSAHNTIPMCGYNGFYTFKMQGGNVTSVHVKSINPITLIGDGLFDTTIVVTPNLDFNLLVPYSVLTPTTIWVTWGDGTTNMASTNNVSCSPLAIVINPDNPESKKELSKVSVYSNKVLITSPKKDKVNLSVITIDGRIISTKISALKSGSNLIDLGVTDLPKGIYLVRCIFSDGQISTVKFLKQ